MSKIGKELIESLTDALAHARGEASGVRVRTVEVPDVRAIRRKLHMSQQEFAETYQIPLPTLKGWEQGRRHPDAPAAAYLRAIARRPVEISAALAPEPA
jgi:putative transcriptional regulator